MFPGNMYTFLTFSQEINRTFSNIRHLYQDKNDIF